MTQQEHDQFRSDFQSILYYYGIVKSKRQYITKMYAFDNNGSHQKAIDNTTEGWKETKLILDEKLSKYGFKNYEEARDFSKQLSTLMERIRANKKSCDRYVSIPLKIRKTRDNLQKMFDEMGMPKTK